MKAGIKIFILSCILAVFSAAAFAQAPQTMNYQGRLADDAGNAIISTVNDVVFTIYDAPTGGSALWTETDTLECDDNGVFMIELGREVPIDPMVFSGEKRWLGIKVGADDEMVPRQLLSSTPYSFSSASPGIAFNTEAASRDIPTPAGALDSIEIDIAVPGYVYVFAQGGVFVNHATAEWEELYFNVSNTANQLTYGDFGFGWVSIPATANLGSYTQTLNIFRVFTETAPGPKKYYFNANAYSGSTNTDKIYYLQMSASFFPSAIGIVDDPGAKKGLSTTGTPGPVVKPETIE